MRVSTVVDHGGHGQGVTSRTPQDTRQPDTVVHETLKMALGDHCDHGEVVERRPLLNGG